MNDGDAGGSAEVDDGAAADVVSLAAGRALGGSACTAGEGGAAASIMGLGMAMVGGETKARINQVTPARQARTGTITATAETHRRVGLRSRIRLPSISMSAPLPKTMAAVAAW